MARGLSSGKLAANDHWILNQDVLQQVQDKEDDEQKKKERIKIVRTNNNKRKGRNSRNCTKSMSAIAG
jgi:hypothetical protein